MVLILSILVAFLIVALVFTYAAATEPSRAAARDYASPETQADSMAIARLGNLFNGLPATVLIQSKFSSIRHSQAAQTMLRALCVNTGLKFDDLISIMENKFATVDRKVFNLIRLAKLIHNRQKESKKIEENLDPWLASLQASRERISQLVEEVPPVETPPPTPAAPQASPIQTPSISAPDMQSLYSQPAESIDELNSIDQLESQAEEEEEEVDMNSPEEDEEIDEGTVIIQDLSQSHEIKYQVLLKKLDILMSETKVIRFLERFTEINEFLNAYIAQVDSQIAQLRKMNDLEIYTRTEGRFF